MTSNVIASLLSLVSSYLRKLTLIRRFSENGAPTRGRIADENMEALQEDITARTALCPPDLLMQEKISAVETKR
jgi:hypothetical protein